MSLGTLQRIDAWEKGFMKQINSKIRQTKVVRPVFIFSFLGSPAIWNTLLGIFPLIFAALHNFTAAEITLACFLQNWLVFHFIPQHIIRRSRPFRQDSEVKCLDALTGTSRYSCPSGHAMYFSHFWLVMAYLSPFASSLQLGLIILAIVGGILLAISRVLLGVHYPTDVLLGLCIPYLSIALYIKFLAPVWSALLFFI